MKLKIFILFIFCVIFATSSFATSIKTPKTVGQGNAFKVQILNSNSDNVIISWLDKEFYCKLSLNKEMSFAGEVYLPMPIDADKSYTLKVTDNHGFNYSQAIKAKKTNWQKQELTVDKKYVTPPSDVQNRIASDRTRVQNALRSLSPSYYDSEKIIRPVNGSVSSKFGGLRVFNGQPRSQHRGVDLRGATGTKIKAMKGGKVLLADDLYYAGNAVYIDHGLGLISFYCHMNKIYVKPEQIVEAGEIIGEVGQTGRVTGPHLHLGVYIFGNAVSPLNFMRTYNGR